MLKMFYLLLRKFQKCFKMFKSEYLDLPENKKEEKEGTSYQGLGLHHCWSAAGRHPSELYCIGNNAYHPRYH